MHVYNDPLKELLGAIAKTLVDHPEKVKVRSFEVQFATILELHVDPEDVGHVIGRHGRIAAAFPHHLSSSFDLIANPRGPFLVKPESN